MPGSNNSAAPDNDQNRDNEIKKALTEIKKILTDSEKIDKQEMFDISERIDNLIIDYLWKT